MQDPKSLEVTDATRRTLLLFLVIPVLFFCLMGSVLYYVPRLNRLADFKIIDDTVKVPGRNYRLAIHNSDDHKRMLYLESNGQAPVVEPLKLFELEDGTPTFSTVAHGTHYYLVARMPSGDLANSYTYLIYDITTAPPTFITREQSCIYPKITIRGIEFELAPQCNYYPFVGDNLRTIRLDLGE